MSGLGMLPQPQRSIIALHGGPRDGQKIPTACYAEHLSAPDAFLWRGLEGRRHAWKRTEVEGLNNGDVMHHYAYSGWVGEDGGHGAWPPTFIHEDDAELADRQWRDLLTSHGFTYILDAYDSHLRANNA